MGIRDVWLLLVLLFSTQSAWADAVILLYHRFGEDRYPATSVRIAQFEAHLSYLAENNYQVWPLDRVVEHLNQGRAIPDKTVAITIDDAYRSVYEQAYPRLKARDWPFTVFVSTEPVDQSLKGFMSWEQMREMARGGASFGNHGVTHRHLLERLPQETESAWRERMHWELETAQQRLRSELQVSTKWFAYPFGEFDQALAELITRAGYIGFGQQSGPVGMYADRLALPRFPMSERYADLPEFQQKIQTLEMPLTAARPWEPLREGPGRPRLELVFAKPLRRALEVRCYVTGQGLANVMWLDSEHTTLVVQARERLPRRA